MIETVQSILNEFSSSQSDTRVHVFEVRAECGEGGWVALNGRVLDEEVMNVLRTTLEAQLPGLQVDYAGVRVLRSSPPRLKTIATNLTGLYAQPSWSAEMLSQLFYGWNLEVLEECPPWVFVRQMDGYLGWAYLPYLTDSPAPEPTHLVIAPASYVRAEISSGSPVVGRLLCGTAAQVVTWSSQFAEIDAQVWGWVSGSDLRALEDLPRLPSAQRREMIVADATRLTGVPYLKGGCSAMGIDSAGFVQLLHRLVGIELPRDADMQYAEGRKIEAPFLPGDLLFFREEGENAPITHVGVSLGGWRIIHSSRAHNGVYLDDVLEEPSLEKNYVGACTFLF